MSARHPQVRQSEQCHQLRRVFGQAAKAHLGVTELALDYPERMLDLGAHLSLGLFNLALAMNPLICEEAVLRASELCLCE